MTYYKIKESDLRSYIEGALIERSIHTTLLWEKYYNPNSKYSKEELDFISDFIKEAISSSIEILLENEKEKHYFDYLKEAEVIRMIDIANGYILHSNLYEKVEE